MVDRPAATRKASRASGRRLVARIARSGSKVVVYGAAPSGSRVTVTLLRGTRRAAVRRTRARYGAYRVAFKVRRAGRYRARVGHGSRRPHGSPS